MKMLNKGYLVLMLTLLFAGSAYLTLETPLLMKIDWDGGQDGGETVTYGWVTISVSVKFTNGSPVEEATVKYKGYLPNGNRDTITEVTDSQGVASTSVLGIKLNSDVGGIEVTVIYNPVGYSKTKTGVGGPEGSTVSVVFDDVPLPPTNGEPPPPPPPTPTYDLTVMVKDQANNVLQGATVDFVGVEEKTTDANGMASHSFEGTQDVVVHVSFSKFGKAYTATETVTVDSSKTVTIVVERLFHWNFHIKYDDGTSPTGKLTLISSQETVTDNITNGNGEVWLNNYEYSLSFKASPTVDLGKLSVTNDGEASYTINPETGDYDSNIDTEDHTAEGEVGPTTTIIRKLPDYQANLVRFAIVAVTAVGLVVGVYLIREEE